MLKNLKCGSSEWMEALEVQIHSLVNEERDRVLGWDPALSAVARSHSLDMAAHGYYEHTNRLGQRATDRGLAAGYVCRKDFGSFYQEGLGENISSKSLLRKDYSLEELAKLVVDSRMDSPGHRQNILDGLYDRQGIGVAIDSDEWLYVTQNFC